MVLVIGVDFLEKKAFDSLVGSLDSGSIDQEILKKVEELPMPSDDPKESVEQIKPDNTVNNSNEQLNSGDAVQETPKPIKKETTVDNKAKAISLAKSKFSANEIARIQGKVANGLTPQDIAEIKALVKSRLSAQEIAKIRELYNNK